MSNPKEIIREIEKLEITRERIKEIVREKLGKKIRNRNRRDSHANLEQTIHQRISHPFRY